MAEPLQSKIGFGSKDNLSAVLEDGRLDAFDLVCLDNQEIGWIDKDGSPVISTSRTQDAITVNGVTGLGVENGYEIPAGKSLDEIVKMLVQKAIPATYTKPTLTLSAPKAKTYEIGEVVTDTLTATFTQNDSQGLSSLAIAQGGTTVASTTEDAVLTTEEVTINIVEGNTTYVATANYLASVTKQNNLGEDSTENAFAAGTLSASKSYVGKRKAFYGCGEGTITATNENVRGLSGSYLNPAANTSFTISLGVGDQWAMFAYPASLRNVSEVMYVETNDSSCADNFTLSTIQVEGANGATSATYKVYIFEMATPAEASMTFKVTI